MSRDKRAILVFYGVVLFLSLLIELLYIRTVITFLLVLLMWIPGIVGMICSRVFYGKEDSLGIASKVEPKYIILGILIPAVFLSCSSPFLSKNSKVAGRSQSPPLCV